MKRMLLFTVMGLLFLVGCGEKDPRPFRDTDPVFSPYIEKFESYLGHKIGDIPIKLGAQEEGTAGTCYTMRGKYKYIVIDKDYWENDMDESAKINLVFHELGHCQLNLGHDETIVEFTMYFEYEGETYSYIWEGPKSFMYPAVFLSDDFSVLLPYYEGELFK